MSRKGPYFERMHPWDSHASGPYYVDHPRRRSFNPPSLMYARHDGPPGAFGDAVHHHDKYTDPIGGYDEGVGSRYAQPGFPRSPLRQAGPSRPAQPPRYFTRYDFPDSYEITDNRLREYPADRPGAFEARWNIPVSHRDFVRAIEGGEDYRGVGPKNWQRSDERILDDVCEKLTIDPRIDASGIAIEVEDGVVNLRGEVHDRGMKRLAEDVAEMARGVRDVRNELSFDYE